MITLNFSVDDQLLTRTDENTVAANSHLVHVCEFAFSSEWNGRGKVATFKKRDLMLSVILDDDACTIPPEILQGENKIDVFELSVCGADGNSTITSTVVKVPILAGTWDVMSTEITPTMFEQIMQKIDEVEKGEISPELVLEAVTEYMEAHPLEPIIADDVAAYFEAHKSEFKGDKGDTGATGPQGETGPQGPKGDNGTTPVISAAATVDNTTGTPAVNVTKAGTDAAPEFTFAFSGLKGPKGDPGPSGYDDTELRGKINDVWKAQGQLGAKNLLPFPYAQKSQTTAGITYTVDDKGRISTSGTSTGVTNFQLNNNLKLDEESYIITDGCADKTTQYIVVWYKHGNTTDVLATTKYFTSATFSITQEQAAAMKNGESYIVVRLMGDNSNMVWDNLTFNPMIRYAGDTDNTWQPYTLTNYELDSRITNGVNNIYQLQGELGAKNLLRYPYYDTSKAMGGITFVVNDDGSVTMNGTSTSYPSFLYALRNYNLKIGEYFITCAEELPNGVKVDVGEANTSGSTAITDYYETLLSDRYERKFTVPSNAQNFAVRIQFNPNVTVSDLTLHVMIRNAEDTDSTWQPYAPTNYDLNGKIEDVKESLNIPSIIGITCWGDSLTAMGGWTQKLQELSGIPVYNGGTGGEDSKCIMARQGGDVMITDGITIPATATAVTIASRATDTGISTELGNKVTPLYQASAHVNPVTLGDIPGTLAWTGSDYTDQNGTWTFTRATAGEAVVIDRPTAIRTNFDDVHNGKNELMIIYMGANGGWNDVADLIHQHKLMIDHFKGKEYVILGLSTGTAASSADYEAAMKEAFGRRFISLREYLAHPIYENGEIVSCYGLADQGLAPGTKEYAGVTYNSLDEIAVGTVPHQLLIDGIHYTTGTREVIGNMLYRKLKELNILA